MSIENYNIKVTRENGSQDEIEFSFRFNHLNERTAYEIKEMLKDYNVIFNKPKGKEFYVILLDKLDSSFDVNLILQIIKKFNLDKESYGFWISITSEYGHGGAFLPIEIREAYKIIGGQLDFSFLVGE